MRENEPAPYYSLADPAYRRPTLGRVRSRWLCTPRCAHPHRTRLLHHLKARGLDIPYRRPQSRRITANRAVTVVRPNPAIHTSPVGWMPRGVCTSRVDWSWCHCQRRRAARTPDSLPWRPPSLTCRRNRMHHQEPSPVRLHSRPRRSRRLRRHQAIRHRKTRADRQECWSTHTTALRPSCP